MIKPQIRSAVMMLRLQNKGIRHIARELDLSRNTVRRIIKDELSKAQTVADSPIVRPARQVPDYLVELFNLAKGNVVRMQELLQSERGEDVPYSTLTRWIRDAELREDGTERSGEYDWKPGEEAQHDTSPHKITIAGVTRIAHCASLILAYSRRLYMQYYPRFTRLEAKHFLLEASRFMDGTCGRVVIDNTSVILAGGSGAEAIVAPEMIAFASTLNFYFLAHELNHSDRKGRIEKPFDWIENNFIPGRTFDSFADLNAQALEWCHKTGNGKAKRVLGRVSPDTVYPLEKPYLQPLPAVLPPVFDVIERIVDVYGFVSVETNRYSVPERLVNKQVSIYAYPYELQIFNRGNLVALHQRVLDRRDVKQRLPGHHSPPRPTVRQPAPEETMLRSAHPLIEQYVNELKRRDRLPRPVQPRRALKRLLEIKRTYPLEPFLAALEQALRFGMFDLGRLEALVLKYVSGDFFCLDDDSEDDDGP
jgi:transposase